MSKKNIKSMLETVESIFNEANNVLDGMNDGDRIQVKELAKTVGLAVGLEPKQVLGFVNHFAHNTDVAYVSRGKNGGIIKGPKVTKVAKPKKDDKAASTEDSSSDSND